MDQSQKSNRPSWDSIWMRFAKTIAERSVDPRHQVGAVIVTWDNTQVLSIGYNGDYAGGPNKVESLEPGQSGFLHAEVNSLIKSDYNNPKKKRMYVTMSPCKQCAAAIINASIDEVVYSEAYRDPAGLDILCAGGIKVRQC